MSGTLLVARRELAAYFNSYLGYSIVGGLLALNGLFFMAFAMGDTAKASSDVLEDFFYYSFGITLAAGVLLTMRLVAEERQTGTIVLIDSSPLSDWEVIAGKWLSAMGFLGIMLVLSGYMPALIFVNGKVSPEQIAVGYLGLALVGSTGTAIGTFTSALARSQIVAAVLGAILVVVLLLAWLLGRVTEPPLDELWSYMSLFDRHYQPFMRGRLNTEDVAFYLSLTFVFLLGSTRVMSARRWQ